MIFNQQIETKDDSEDGDIIFSLKAELSTQKYVPQQHQQKNIEVKVTVRKDGASPQNKRK